MRQLLLFLATLLVVALAASPALALEERSGATAGVAAGETVDDDLLLTGSVVTVAGHVTGDVYAFGQTVSITGVVDGDVFAAAQQVTVNGTVGGSARAAGALVSVGGRVGRNLLGLGQQVVLAPTGEIGGNTLLAGETAQIAGRVAGNLEAQAATLQIDPMARIGGNLRYSSRDAISLPEGVVGGTVTYRQPDWATQPPAQPEPLNGLFNWFGLAWLVGSVIAGLALLWLFPAAGRRFVAEVRGRPVHSLVLGIAALVVLPVALVIAGLTVVGLPLALLGLGGYLAGLYLGWLLVGFSVGAWLAGLLRGPGRPADGWLLAAGLAVLYLLTHIPVLGPLVTFVGLALGLGGLLLVLYTWRRPAPATTAQPAVVAAAPPSPGVGEPMPSAR